MDIDNNSIDFRDRGGKQSPSYMSIKRITTRKSVLCISKRIELNNKADRLAKQAVGLRREI